MLKSLVARSSFFYEGDWFGQGGEKNKHYKTGPSRGGKKNYYNTGRRAARLCWKEKKITNIENYDSARGRLAL